jgi:hypothetical protein
MADRSAKDKAMAAELKKRGVQRTTGMCPMGCGRALPNGGGALVPDCDCGACCEQCGHEPDCIRNEPREDDADS